MLQLTLALLGTYQASVGGKPITHFATDKNRALLAYLAVEAGRPHRRDTLATLLWPDWTEAAARSNLRLALHRLRQTFDKAAGGLSEELLEITRETVQTNVAALDLDVARFLHLLDTCELHPHRLLHLCPSCLAQLGEAAALYGGELLAGFSVEDAPPFEQWELMRREELGQRILSLLYRLADAFEQRGEYEQALVYARQQIALDPFREEAHRQTMRFFALQGERAAALAQYERCRQLLWDELGVEPDEETVALFEQIQHGQLQHGRGPARPLLYHFPAQFTPFLGREAEVATLVASLQEPTVRLLTIVAPGGMGKSRLAMAAAQALAEQPGLSDGIYFVNLTRVATADLLPSALAQSLGLNLGGQAEPAQQLFHFVEGKALLLVLDNFEHLLEGAGFLGQLLEQAPGVQCLVSSREALNLAGEQRLPLEGLADEAASRLFVQSAQRVWAGFQAGPEALAAVQAICQNVGGIPLAIELAASWVRLMDVGAIAQQIQQDLDFLTTTMRDLPARQRSMRAVFEQAWAKLAAAEQRALARLSVFRGPFRLEAAVAITQTTAAVVARLIDRSLLRQVSSSGRFELHELLRQFAAEKLRSFANLEGETRERHGRYYLQFVAEQEAALNGPEPKEALAELQQRLANIRLAWQWAVDHDAVDELEQARPAMGVFYRFSGLLREGANLFGAAATALQQQIESGRLAEDVGWPAVYRLWQSEANLLELQGAGNEALQRLEQARAGWERRNDQSQLCQVLGEIGYVHGRQFHLAEAHHFLDKCLELAQETEDARRVAFALHHKADALLFAGDMEAATTLFVQSIERYRATGDQRGLAGALCDFGAMHGYNGDFVTSQRLLAESLALYEALGDRLGSSLPLGNIGAVALDSGDLDTAETYSQRAVANAQEVGDKLMLCVALGNLGHVALTRNDRQGALRYYRDTLTLAQEAGPWHMGGEALIGLASIARYSEPSSAVRWLAAFHAWRQAMGFGADSVFVQRVEEETLARLRETFDEERFGRLWEEGLGLALEAAAGEGLGFVTQMLYRL